MTMTLWTADPEARALLAQAAITPPARIVRKDPFGDKWEECTGKLARDLRRVRNRYLDQALKLSDETGDESEFSANLLLSVETAVDAAVGDYQARRAA
jgi:hypothetical protein